MTTNAPNRVVILLRGVGLVFSGALVLALSLLELRSIQNFVDHARRADGTVVSLTAGPAHSEVRFVLPDTGEFVTFPGNGLGASHRVGEQVKVLFRRSDGVVIAKLDEPVPLWGFCLLTIATGAGLMIGGALTLLRKTNTQSEAWQ